MAVGVGVGGEVGVMVGVTVGVTVGMERVASSSAWRNASVRARLGVGLPAGVTGCAAGEQAARAATISRRIDAETWGRGDAVTRGGGDAGRGRRGDTERRWIGIGGWKWWLMV